MKIKTITCHHVYNYGASLQAYALQHYLESLGHEVEIIDFNPWFHCDRYNPFWMPKNAIGRAASIIKKFPLLRYIWCPYKAYRGGMFKTWGRKAVFDAFEKEYYHLTSIKYFSSEELKLNPPMADAYIAGSDQIWNTFSNNGKEPGYYLDFGNDQTKRFSYAASLATNSIKDECKDFIKEKLAKFSSISVREKTGASLLADLGISNVSVVLDPVFLLDKSEWKQLSLKGNLYGLSHESYVLVYDFLGNDDNMISFVKAYAKEKSLKIVSINDFSERGYADININNAGPLDFLSLIDNAACVVASSFHATAFSVILEKEFYTFNLKGYNNSSRMLDFLSTIGLQDRMNSEDIIDNPIDWKRFFKFAFKIKTKQGIFESTKVMERVHYYSDYDMSIPLHIERMADVVRSYEEGNQPDGINDYLEMYHIVQFIEYGKYPQDWDENKIAAIKQYKGKVAAYFSHLQSNDLPVIWGEIERGYESTIWQIIDQFRIKGLITENGLREILKEKIWLLKDLLEHRWIVEQNQILLTALLKENEHTAEWLLEQYVEDDRFGQHRVFYFPKSLTGTDKDTIVRNYVNSDKANLNYVRLVLVAKCCSEFPLHPLTIKDARRKEQILNKAILELGSIHLTSYGVALTEEKNAPVKESRVDEEGRTMFVYDKNVIDECKDATIVYYCGQVFEFTEEYGFISLISKDAEKNTMEKVVGFYARNTYDVDMVFRMRENLSHLQLLALEQALKANDRDLEGVVKDFYESFLKEEYGYAGLPLTLPKESDELILKIRSLAIEMDAVSHQYDCYVEYGSIDKDIVELTPPQKLTQTKSLTTRRYCVVNKDNNDVWYLLYLLFGSQSMLFFVEPCKDAHFKNYYELLVSGIDVRYDDYENYQKPYIDSLLDKGYLTRGEDGVLRCQKMQEIEVLKHLYEYRACSYWGYPKKERAILDEMVSKGWIEFDAHLLSPAERDYFSYYLNNEKFTNGPAIRNNYAHGTTPSYSEEKHLHNYLQLLILFVLLLLKISEDLDMKRYLEKYGLEK